MASSSCGVGWFGRMLLGKESLLLRCNGFNWQSRGFAAGAQLLVESLLCRESVEDGFASDKHCCVMRSTCHSISQ